MSGTETETATMDDDDGWGDALAEAGEAPPPPVTQPARVLNQAEIDSLLGFDDGPGGGETRSGIQQIISSGLISYERLPMLEIVFDRLVRIMSTSLRNFTSDNVEVGIDNILSLRFGDYLNSIPLPAIKQGKRTNDIPAGIAVSADGKKIYVAANLSSRLLELDASNGKVLRTWNTGVAPLPLALKLPPPEKVICTLCNGRYNSGKGGPRGVFPLPRTQYPAKRL